MKLFSRKILCVLCVSIMLFTLAACQQSTTNPNQAFIDANNNVPTTEPATTPTAESTRPSDTTPPTTTPSTDITEPSQKPDGFTWTDWGDVGSQTTPPTTSAPSTPSTPVDKDDKDDKDDENDVTAPTKPQNPVSTNMSQSLQSALSSLGKTTKNGSNFTAYLPKKDNSGGINIVHIKSTSSSATKTTYIFYESKSDYNNAKSAFPHKTFNDNLRLITMSTEETFPITNPEASSYILFSGYQLWR